MKKVLRKSNLVAGILILVVVCLGIVLAGDVIVKEGTLEAENIDATGDVSGATITRNGTEINAGYLAIDGSNASDDIDIGGCGFIAAFIEAGCGLMSNGFLTTSGDVYIGGKLTVVGDTDPKTLELELQERNGVIDRYEKYVTPGKKSGVVYINSETKQIEIYYPYVGVIKNMLGETIYSLPSIRINNNYENYYVFDTLTGQIVEKQRAIYDKYRIKEGIEFDSTTGQFIDQTSKEIIPKEEAIELYK